MPSKGKTDVKYVENENYIMMTDIKKYMKHMNTLWIVDWDDY